jgi:SAM-dependent methyltransferase
LVIAAEMGADVAGLDAAPNLVAIARGRLPGARIEIGEMEELPFADKSFDIVTGINSFQFAGDLVSALKEARRVLKEGGTLLMLVWGRRQDCELVSGTASAVFALLPPSTDSRPPLAFAEPGVIEEVMAEAGLVPTGSGEFAGPIAAPDVETAVKMVLSASARAIRTAGEAAVANAIRGTLPPFTRPDGSVVWNNRFRWVTATPA